MAKKKQEEQNVNPNEQNTDQSVRQDAEVIADNMARETIANQMNKAIEQQRIAEHQMINKSHDTEFTDASDLNTKTLQNVTADDIAKAYQTLIEYKRDKAELEDRIAENEEFWKMNHWDVMEKGTGKADDKRVKPRSAWLFNLIINKHADAMDNYPDANILPRAKDDEQTAEILSDIIPVILEQNSYEDVYSDCQWYKCKNGTSVQGVFWNNDKDNGMGNIDIKKVDLLNLFWKANITDIEDSPNVFYVTMVDNDALHDMYPDLVTGTGNALSMSPLQQYYDSKTELNHSAVVDWYYKKRVQVTDELGVPKINTVLHFCKFCNNQIIYASENDPKYADRGWYDHGKYPFVFDTLFPKENDLAGIGYIDIEKDNQIFIDKGQQAILESMIVNARPRYFFRSDGQVNEEEFLDLSSPVIHVEGSISENSILPVSNSQFSSVYESILLNKIEELKDTSGNTAASQGQSTGQSGSAIASLQEAAGKLSRDSNKTSYRAFKKVVDLVIELIRQFYDEPRCFRIEGERGENQFVTFDNRGLVPQDQGSAFGVDLGSRLPILDIDVKPQKKNAFTKEGQNQTALNLYSMGFFAPNNADSSLACLNMMDFDNIENVKDTVAQNGTLYQQVQMLMQQNVQLMALLNGQNPQEAANQMAQAQTSSSGSNQTQGGGTTEKSRGSLSTQAAASTRGSTAPQ